VHTSDSTEPETADYAVQAYSVEHTRETNSHAGHQGTLVHSHPRLLSHCGLKRKDVTGALKLISTGEKKSRSKNQKHNNNKTGAEWFSEPSPMILPRQDGRVLKRRAISCERNNRRQTDVCGEIGLIQTGGSWTRTAEPLTQKTNTRKKRVQKHTCCTFGRITIESLYFGGSASKGFQSLAHILSVCVLAAHFLHKWRLLLVLSAGPRVQLVHPEQHSS